MAQAREASDLAGQAVALGELGLGYLGDDRQLGIEYTDEAILIVDGLGDGCWESVLLRQRGSLIDLGPKAKFYQHAVAAARGGGCPEQVALSLLYLSTYLPNNDPAVGTHLEDAVRHARLSGGVETLHKALVQLARYRVDHGDNRALLDFAEVVALHRAAGDRRREMNALWNLGVTHAVLGQPETGIPYCEQYIRFHRDAGHSTTWGDENLAELRRRAGV